MGRKMTEKELAEYMTVAEKTKIFVEKYQPLGMFMKSSHYRFKEDGNYFITVEMKIYSRNSQGQEFLMANAIATENRTLWDDKKVEVDRFCETSSRGRALSVLGIGLTSMSSREDLDRETNYSGEKSKSTNIELPSAEDTVKRLKVEYLIVDGMITVPISNLKARTISVLERYGFVKKEKDLVRAL